MQKFAQKHLKQLISIFSITVGMFLAFSLVMNAMAEIQKPVVVNSQNKNILLSDRLTKAVLADISKQTGIPTKKFKITQYNHQTWSNGCLGIAKPDEICPQALVEGWRIVVSGNYRTWVYRSDLYGRLLRLEP